MFFREVVVTYTPFTGEVSLVVQSFNFRRRGKSSPLFRDQKKHFSRPADSIIVNSSTKVSTRFVSVDSSNRHEQVSLSLTSFNLSIASSNAFSYSYFLLFRIPIYKLAIFWHGRWIIHRKIVLTSTIYSMYCDMDVLRVHRTNCCFSRHSEQFEWTF